MINVHLKNRINLIAFVYYKNHVQVLVYQGIWTTTSFPYQVIHEHQPGASLFGQGLYVPPSANLSRRKKKGKMVPGSGSDGSVKKEHDNKGDACVLLGRQSTFTAPKKVRHFQIQKEPQSKIEFVNELIQMKRDGYKLSSIRTIPLSHEHGRENQKIQKRKHQAVLKVVINMGCHGLQMLNTVKGPWLPMEGWAEAVTADMNVYDRPLRRIHRQYFSRGPAGNPWVELGFALIGSLVFHIMVAKMMGTKNGAAMFAKMFNSGGITGALAGMAGMGNGAPQVGPGQMPQSTPNPSNPYKNHNVPPVPPQPRAPPRPPPQPPRHQPPPSYPVDRAPPTVNRAPVTSARPPVHPQQAGIRPESYHPPSRPTPKTERQKKRKPMRRPGMVMQSPRPYVPPSPSKDDMGSESTMNLDTSE